MVVKTTQDEIGAGGRPARWSSGMSPPLDAPSPAAAVEGLDELRRLLGDEVLRDVTQLFVEEGERRLQAVRVGLARRDAAAIAREAHAFKGCSASLGARALSALCGRLETAARIGHADGAAFEAVVGEFLRVSGQLGASEAPGRPTGRT